MNFVLVNDRTPFRKNFCVICSKPVGEEGYLREIRTRLCYCGPACYAFQSNSGTLLMEIQCRAS
jgi:hypothetical protein